jgi:hypothetical protein
MRANTRIIPVLLFAAFVAACGDGTTAVSNSVVSAVREGNALRISNRTDEARAFAASDPEWLALVDLSLTYFCTTTDSGCLRLPANGSVLVPFSDVGGYGSSTKAITVWTWRVGPDGAGGRQAVMDDAITLKL